MQVLKFFVRDAQLDPPERIRFHQVHKFPANRAWRKLSLHLANEFLWRNSLEKPPYCSGKANVYLRHAQLDRAVGALFRKVHVVYANHFSSAGINDLLIEQ